MSTKLEAISIQHRALDALRKEFGHDKVSAHGGKVGDTGARLYFDFVTATPEQVAIILRGRFCRFAPALGLVPSDFDLPLQVNGQLAQLVAVEPNRLPYPFTVLMQDGRRLKVNSGTFLAARARVIKMPATKSGKRKPINTKLTPAENTAMFEAQAERKSEAMKDLGKRGKVNGHPAPDPFLAGMRRDPAAEATRKYRLKGKAAREARA